jgi:cytochrome c553
VKRMLAWGLVLPAVLRASVPRWILENPLVVAARHPWIALGIVGAALAIGGLLVAVSGVMPVKASSGHWAITEALLQFSKRRSISTHSLGITVPPLDDPSLVLRGAGHYDLGCRPCHGTPRGDRPQVALAMLPIPPLLAERVPAWSPAELFSIVKHGLKFTGMPAWPSQQRDDEVWAMVAFLGRYPELTDTEYLRLTRGDSDTTLALEPAGDAAPEVVRGSCARCHGLDGNGRGTGFPKLSGQRPEYLRRALQAYADGRRYSGIMASVASGLTAETIDGAVRFYAGRTAGVAGTSPTRERLPDPDLGRGDEIAMAGVPARDIPACVECHGPVRGEAKHAAYPRLAGQYAEYLALQLRLLQQRRRGGSEYVDLMHSFVDRLTDEDIRDVSAFFASLEPVDPAF